MGDKNTESSKKTFSEEDITKALELIRDNAEHKRKTGRKKQLVNAWYDYAYSFADASVELLNVVIKSEKDKKHFKRTLNIPLMFNVRHTIELTLKYFSKITNNEAEIEKTHNIIKQFVKVQNSLETKEGEIDFLSKRHVSEGITKEKIVQQQKLFAKKLELIVYRYFFYSPFFEGISSDDFFIEDTNNELFKYPEAKNINFYFSTNFALNLDITKIIEIRVDMLDLRRMLRFFEILFWNPR